MGFVLFAWLSLCCYFVWVNVISRNEERRMPLLISPSALPSFLFLHLRVCVRALASTHTPTVHTTNQIHTYHTHPHRGLSPRWQAHTHTHTAWLCVLVLGESWLVLISPDAQLLKEEKWIKDSDQSIHKTSDWSGLLPQSALSSVNHRPGRGRWGFGVGLGKCLYVYVHGCMCVRESLFVCVCTCSCGL